MFSLFKPNKEKSKEYLSSMRELFSAKVPNADGYQIVYANRFEERKGIVAKTSLYHNYILGYRGADDPMILLKIDTALSAVGEAVFIDRRDVVKARVTLAKDVLMKTQSAIHHFTVPPFVVPVGGVLFFSVRQEAEAKAFMAFFKDAYVGFLS